MIRLARASLILGLLGAAVPAAAADGAALYRRCAACHLPSGAGVPGSFPPLGANVRALAARPDGRRYLILVVARGIAGPIEVAGRTYRDFMPAQGGLSDADLAAVLNHVVARAGGRLSPFTPAEVAAVRRSGATVTAAGVGRLRPADR